VKTYPFKLPDSVENLKAELLGSAGAYSSTFALTTPHVRVIVRDGSGTFWRSKLYPLSDIPSTIQIRVPTSRSYSVLVEWYDIGRRLYPLRGFARIPFLIRKGSKLFVTVSVAKKDPRFKQALAKARLRANSVRRIPRQRIPRSKTPGSESTMMEQWKVKYIGPNVYSQTPWTWYPYSLTKSSVNTANFMKLKREGKLPLNPYSMVVQTIEDGGCYQDTIKLDPNSSDSSVGPYTSFFGGGEFGNPPTGLVDRPDIYNRAVSKLQDSTGASNGIAQNLAQINQTVNMIALTANRIGSSLIALRKGNFSAAVSNLTKSRIGSSSYKGSLKKRSLSASRTLAENWLELQYGWKPLLSDLHATMESLAKMNMANILPITTRSTAQGNEVKVSDLTLNTAGNAKTGIVVEHSIWIYRFGLRYVIDDHFKSFLAQSGFTNPVNLIWELLPFSFVVDWFVPIGPFLETLAGWEGLTFESGWQSTLKRKMTFYDCSYSGKLYPLDPTDQTWVNLGGNYRHVAVSYGRSVLTGFPSKQPPVLKSPISVDHALNAMALLRTAFRK